MARNSGDAGSGDGSEEVVSVQTDSPLAVELFAGTGSGTAGWVESGGLAACFDLEYLSHHGDAPAGSMRVIQDVTTLHGSQFKDAAWIWASPPCTWYSYLAMPWSRSKCPLCKGKKQYFAWQLIPDRPPASADVRTWGDPIACDCKENSWKAKELRADWIKNGPDNRLFDDCYRIQEQAIRATCTCPAEGIRPHFDGCKWRYIPLLVENVRGAIPWVGKRDMPLDQWNALSQPERIKLGTPAARFGSFMIFGDAAQIGKRVIAGRDLEDIRAGRGRFGMGVAPEKGELKGHGSTWFGIQNNGDTYDQREVNPVSGTKGTKPYPNRGWTAGTAISLGLENYNGVKVSGQIQGKEYAMCRTGAAGQTTLGGFPESGTKTPGRSLSKGAANKFGTHNMGSADKIAVELGVKQPAGRGDWFSKEARDGGASARFSSKSNARKAASALIARIPYALSRYIAEQHYPAELSKTARTG